MRGYSTHMDTYIKEIEKNKKRKVWHNRTANIEKSDTYNVPSKLIHVKRTMNL